MQRTFYGLLEKAWGYGLGCVGLDPDPDLFPTHLKEEYGYTSPQECGRVGDMIKAFNLAIIDATKDNACAYKMNWAQYLAFGTVGISALQRTIDHIRIYAPHALVILDAKPGDGDNTNKFYVRAAFDELKADAVTVNPYMGGEETFAPFLDRKDKGVIFLCKTSNRDSGTLQDIKVGREQLYMKVARNVMSWNHNRNCALVVGATYPTALERIRHVIGDSMPILCPGAGRQGGNVAKTVRLGKDSRSRGLLISSSTGIIYASQKPDFAEVAKRELQLMLCEVALEIAVKKPRHAIRA
jgi:orotidine-5'-phosphate decarboxylase